MATTTKPTRRSHSKMMFRLKADTFLLPIIAVFLILQIIPLLQTLYFSFTNYRGLSTHVKFIGLENYAKIFSNQSLSGGLLFTIIFAVSSTVLITVIAIPLAVILNQKFFGRAFARALFFFVGIPSQAIIGLVWQYIFSPLPTGALNSLLSKLGISAIPWLANPQLARAAVIFVAVWAGVGWHATLYLAYLQAIPSDLYESAAVDGANPVQRFVHITLPQLTPAIVVSTFLLVSGGLKIYDLPYAMTTGGPGYATTTVTQSIILQGVAQGNYGLGSALAVLFTLASIVIVFAQIGVATRVAKRFE